MKYLIVLLLMCATPLYAAEVVEERYDEVWVVYIENRGYETLYFIRDGKLIATRLFQHQADRCSTWTTQGEDFVLTFIDHNCERVIKFKTFGSVIVPTCDATNKTRAGPWWAMKRPMTNLKQPEGRP